MYEESILLGDQMAYVEYSGILIDTHDLWRGLVSRVLNLLVPCNQLFFLGMKWAFATYKTANRCIKKIIIKE